MRRPVQVAVYIAGSDGSAHKYLLLKRPTKFNDIWQGVTGGVEGSEEYVTAALRELKEETGFVPRELLATNYTYHFEAGEMFKELYRRRVHTITEVVYLALVDGLPAPVIDPVEHVAWQWCSFSEALDLLFWSGNKSSLIVCESILKNRQD